MRRLGAVLPLITLILAAACAPSESTLDREWSAIRGALLRGELTDAQARADRVLQRAASANPSPALWRVKLLRAEIAVQQRNFADAVPLLTAALPDGARFDPLRAQQQYVAAKMAVAQEKFADARAALARGRPLAPDASPARLDIDALDGQILLRLGKWDDAEAELNTVLARAESDGDRVRAAVVLNDLGMSRFVRSRYDEALPYFERVISLDELRDYTVYAISLSNTGFCYSRLGQFDRAMSIEQRAFEIHRQRGPRVYFEQALGQLGNLHVLRGDPAAGLPYFQQALQVSRDAHLMTHAELWAGNLSTAYADLHRWDEAERYNEEAKRLWAETHSGAPVYHTLNAATIAAGRQHYDDARGLYETALATPGAPPSVRWDAHFGLAGIAEAQEDVGGAAREFEAALGVIEQTRAGLLKTDYKVSYLTQLIAFYQAYVDLLVSRGQSERALEVADSSRGRVLAERGRTSAPARATAAAFKALAARSHAVLLSYWLAPERSYLWVVAADGVHTVTLPGAKTIEALVREHQAAVANALVDPLAARGAAGDRLYQALIAPASRWLPANASVVVIPDGALHGINFETLPVDGARRHYWIEDVEVQVAPSLTSLVESRPQHPQTQKGLLLIGDAQERLPDFPALRFASAEMAAIETHFSGAVTAFAGERATPQAYRSAHPDRFNYLHFTAHATTSADSPLDSAVILSGPEHAYKLYARDVAELPLSADLVTVSACRSAGERAYSGEGLVGFSWAFLRAGAQRVVAGLWDVDDRSTSELMDRLYANLVAGDLPARALRRAKLAMLARGGASASPYRWAPFELFTRRM